LDLFQSIDFNGTAPETAPVAPRKNAESLAEVRVVMSWVSTPLDRQDKPLSRQFVFCRRSQSANRHVFLKDSAAAVTAPRSSRSRKGMEVWSSR